MSKLSAKKHGKVHPFSPPHGHLALLPAAILTLAATLSPEDKEVLAYLISCSGSLHNPKPDPRDAVVHSSRFDCSCFKCYTSFWSRWDASPNRELIHKIIEVYEDGLFRKKTGSKVKKRRKNNRVCDEEEEESDGAYKLVGGDQVMMEGGGGDVRVPPPDGSGNIEVIGSDKGTVRKIVSFIGERIWSVWNKV